MKIILKELYWTNIIYLYVTDRPSCGNSVIGCKMYVQTCKAWIKILLGSYAGANYTGWSKKRYPNFIFAITSVNVHRF